MIRFEAYKNYIDLETDQLTLQGLASMQRTKLAKQSADLENRRSQLAVIEKSYADLYKMMQITAERRKLLAGETLAADTEALSVAAFPDSDSNDLSMGASSTAVNYDLTEEFDERKT